MSKYKARLVVKGYTHVFGVEFSKTFSPVARLDIIISLLSVATQKSWKVFQLDVKFSLNGYLKEEIFVEQPDSFVVQGQENKERFIWT